MELLGLPCNSGDFAWHMKQQHHVQIAAANQLQAQQKKHGLHQFCVWTPDGMKQVLR